ASLESSVISVFKQPLLICAMIWHIWWGCRGDAGYPLGVGARPPAPPPLGLTRVGFTLEVGAWGRAKPAPRADFSGGRAGGFAASTTTRKGIRKGCALPYLPL